MKKSVSFLKLLDINWEDQVFEYDPFVKVDAVETEMILETYIDQTMKEHGMKKSKEWEPTKLDEILQQIGNKIVDDLASLKKPFKFIVLLEAYPNIGAGVDINFIADWEPRRDGHVKHEWANDVFKLWGTIFWIAV